MSEAGGRVSALLGIAPNERNGPMASIGKSTISGIFTDGTLFALSIVVSVVLTRSLGPEQRGVYALLVTTNVLVSNMAHLSAGRAFINMLARGRYSLGEVNTLAVLLSLILGAILLGATASLYPFLPPNLLPNVPYSFLLVAMALTAATIYQIYWSAMMVGLNRIIVMNKLNLAINLSSSVLMISAVGLFGWGLIGFLAVWTLSSIAGMLGALFLSARIDRPVWPPRWTMVREALGFGLRSHPTNVAHHLFLRLDLYIVNALIGAAAVGFYSVSTSLAEKLWLPLNALHASSAGKVTQLPRDESALLAAKVSRTSVLLILMIALPFGLVSPWLIPFLYGAEFSASVLPLVILLGGVLSFSVMMVLNNYIVGQMQRPGLLSIISWLQVAISLPLYVVLILWQGIVGAALASSITYILSMLSTLIIFVRDSGLPPRSVLLPRPEDFRDYLRIFRAGLNRVPGLRRYARRTP